MFTDPLKLHAAAIDSCIPTIAEVLEKSGFRGIDIDHTIPHQTAGRAIRLGTRHVLAALGPSNSKVVNNLRYLGNTASTTHFVALYDQLRERRISPGERVLMIVYASGLVIGALVFTMDELAEGNYGSDHRGDSDDLRQ